MSPSRRLIPLVLLFPLASCGYRKPSPKDIEAALMGTGVGFSDPKMVVVPRRIEVHTDESFGSGSLDDRQMDAVDPVVGILHANRLVDVRDVHSSDGGGGYRHILSVAECWRCPNRS